MRIGQGYDVHRLAEGRDLILGGCLIPHSHGLLGHSDADVLTHAIIDALLGALALGDIGRLFPDTDKELQGISSMILLEKVIERIWAEGYVLSNLDATIIAEAPKLAPHIIAIRESLARVLGVPISCVSVKATTEEGLGFTGTREGMAAQSIALLIRR